MTDRQGLLCYYCGEEFKTSQGASFIKFNTVVIPYHKSICFNKVIKQIRNIKDEIQAIDA
jgi:hypothetical protein